MVVVAAEEEEKLAAGNRPVEVRPHLRTPLASSRSNRSDRKPVQLRYNRPINSYSVDPSVWKLTAIPASIVGTVLKKKM